MGHMHHFSAGWVTPVLSYVMAVLGSALGLRCTVRALGTEGRSRRNWLLTAAVAIGAGIWTMHFIAMLGFGVSGTPIRYDVWRTVLSLLVAIVVVGAGVCTVGHWRSRIPALLAGGLATGLGVASMHYLGMSAVRLHGRITYAPGLVALSVVIAVVAATAALGAALIVRRPVVAALAALVMGVAVSSMHYTGMAAIRVAVTPGGGELSGATTTDFIFPLAVVLGSFLFLTCAFVALSPTARERSAAAEAARPLADVELPAT
ncbi:MHYT domain-containing protein [Streptomyces sp. KL116D]|uniref:MHYT domain-containing protein n=1 Tax=Streptomyces sp. KL116D TaxID=3045152 RepID=UPI0035576C9F